MVRPQMPKLCLAVVAMVACNACGLVRVEESFSAGTVGKSATPTSSSPASLGGATRTVEVYKTVGNTRLSVEIFDEGGGSNKPAIVFFFGGGWSNGSRQQFESQARYFAARGMVAITADYRVRSQNQSRVIDSISDARSAMKWVRANAKRLKIDPNKIAASGGSAGGHLAACTAFVSEFDDPRDPQASAVPNALVLFNPALVLAPLTPGSGGSFAGVPPVSFLGAEAPRVSPAHHITKNGPPTVIFHGQKDRTVPIETARMFVSRMKESGNRCELVEYPGQPHAFYNGEPWKSRTLQGSDEFLVSLGWIKAK